MAYGEIRENTQLNEKELNKTVQSLVDVKLLEQEPQVSNVDLTLLLSCNLTTP